MRNRSVVQVERPPGSGKTTLIERLLEAELGLALGVRAEKDPRLKAGRESAPRGHDELRRYCAAGATEATLWRFPRRDAEAFFTTRFMDEYSEVVYVEGDDPTSLADLTVFVAPPLPERGSIFVRAGPEGRPRRARGLRSPSSAWATRRSRGSSAPLTGEPFPDAHCFPTAYMALGIGETVGMQVPGTCTSVWWERLQDKTLTFGIPEVGHLDPKGDLTENKHLNPDHEVDNAPALEATGRDQQLETAVEVLLKKLPKK